MKILFAGTPSFAVPALEAVAGRHAVAGVLTSPDRPAGRGRQPIPSAVKARALELGLPLLQPEELDAGFRDGVRALAADILVAVAFGRIFRAEFLDLFPRGGLNVHPSLLPRFRGPSPIPAAILAGERETGVTVQRLALRMDAGDILGVDRVALDGSETTASLTGELARRGAALLVGVLDALEKGDLPGTPQAEEAATWCRLVGKEDGRIDWNWPAERIGRMIRAYDPWPRAWTTFQGQTLALLEGGPAPQPATAAPAGAGVPDESGGRGKSGVAGQVLAVDKRHGILVQTGDGPLGIRRLQLQARKPLDWQPFLNGHPDFIDALLGG